MMSMQTAVVVAARAGERGAGQEREARTVCAERGGALDERPRVRDAEAARLAASIARRYEEVI